MSCPDKNTTISSRGRGNGYVVVIILYILLAIILCGVGNY